MVTRHHFRLFWGFLIAILIFLNVTVLVMLGIRLNTPRSPILEPPTITLENDKTPPEITLNGEPEITILAGKTYTEKGAEVSDNADPVVLEMSGEVDTNTPGTYYIKYQAVDFSGNHTIKKRKVKVIEKKGTIYLTFDDGPSDYTATLLDTLKKYDTKATFFVTGKGDDALIMRAFEEGHALGAHTASHNYAYIYQNTDNFLNDLNLVRTRIQNLTGLKTNLMRFPGGSSNLVSKRYDKGSKIMSRLTKIVTENGWTYFDWNIDSDDAGSARDPETVFENVVSGLKNYNDFVVLQHDTKDYSINAVEKIIQYGLENGYDFQKLDANSYSAHHGVNN